MAEVCACVTAKRQEGETEVNYLLRVRQDCAALRCFLPDDLWEWYQANSELAGIAAVVNHLSAQNCRTLSERAGEGGAMVAT